MPKPERQPDRTPAAVRKRVTALEDQIVKFEGLIARVDSALANPDAFLREKGKAAQLGAQRRELQKALAAAEEEWLELSGELERI